MLYHFSELMIICIDLSPKAVNFCSNIYMSHDIYMLLQNLPKIMIPITDYINKQLTLEIMPIKLQHTLQLYY